MRTSPQRFCGGDITISRCQLFSFLSTRLLFPSFTLVVSWLLLSWLKNGGYQSHENRWFLWGAGCQEKRLSGPWIKFIYPTDSTWKHFVKSLHKAHISLWTYFWTYILSPKCKMTTLHVSTEDWQSRLSVSHGEAVTATPSSCPPHWSALNVISACRWEVLDEIRVSDGCNRIKGRGSVSRGGLMTSAAVWDEVNQESGMAYLSAPNWVLSQQVEAVCVCVWWNNTWYTWNLHTYYISICAVLHL